MTLILFIQLLIVLALIFIGARTGGIGLGIYGMLGVFILVFVFGLQPGKVPIDVMLIIVSVITATAMLEAAGGLDYLVQVAARFLRKHPEHITYYGPLTTWLFCHTSYSLLPIISEIATNNKIRPERPMTVATIAASLGITGSPMSAATAALISNDLLGAQGIELKDILLICIPASFVAILVAAFVQNFVGKELEDDPEYQRRVREGLIVSEEGGASEVFRVCLSDRRGAGGAVRFCSVVAPVVRGQWRAGASVDDGHDRDGDDVGGGAHSARLPCQCGESRQWQHLPGRYGGGGSHFRYCVDGRHVLYGQYGVFPNADIPYRHAVSLSLLRCPVPDEHHALLTSGSRAHPLSAGHRTGHQSVGTHCHVPGSQRLLLYSQLPHGGGSHQLRPDGNDAHRQVCAQPFVPACRIHHDHCQHRTRVRDNALLLR